MKKNNNNDTNTVSTTVISKCQHPSGGTITLEREDNQTQKKSVYLVFNTHGLVYRGNSKRKASKVFGQSIQLDITTC